MGKSYFDFKEYTEYVKKLGIAEKQLMDWLKQFLLQEAERVVSKGKPRTPVDTGALQRSWEVGVVQFIGNNLQVEIKLPMEYASYIEYGHHSYQGRYMMAISVDEVYRAMPARFNQAFKEWISRMGVAD